MPLAPSDAIAYLADEARSGREEGLMGHSTPDRIVIADDHPLMRAALGAAVRQAFCAAATAEAADYAGLRAELARGPAPDVILLDLHMPGMNGFIGLALLRSERPEIPVIVVSASDDGATVQRALDYGASGFVSKSAPVAQIAEAVSAVMDGCFWAPRSEGAEDAEDAAMTERVAALTPQQLRVLGGIAEGKLNKQIAWEMGVSEQTVKDHVSTILRRLGAANRTQAALIASRLAFRPPESAV